MSSHDKNELEQFATSRRNSNDTRRQENRAFLERQKRDKQRLTYEQAQETRQMRATHRAQIAVLRVLHSRQKTTLAHSQLRESTERRLMKLTKPERASKRPMTPDLDQ
jgi:hypothetical protein